MKRGRTQFVNLENAWKRQKTNHEEHDVHCTSHICGKCESVMSASKANHVHCLDKLLSQCEKADNTVENGTRSALFYAIGQGYVSCVRLLLDYSPGEVNVIQQSGIAPLHMSAGAGHVEIMRELIKRGADVNLRLEVDQLNPLHICASFGALDCLKLLLENGADPLQQTSDSSMNALHFAAYHGNISCLQALLDYGCDINVISLKSHRSVLHYAMCQGKIECFEFLVKNNADITLLDINGHSALMCAPLTEPTLKFDAIKYFSVNERRKWLSYASVDVKPKPQTFTTQRKVSSEECYKIFLEISNLLNHNSLFERVPIIEFCFDNEIGKGSGVTREWFSQFDENLLESIITTSPNKKYHEFTRCSNFTNEKKERVSDAAVIGMIFALALIYGHVVPINMPPYIFKILLGVSLDLSDLKLVDEDLFESQILYLQNCSTEELAQLGLSFTQAEQVNGKLIDIELVDGGSNILVTHENLTDYFSVLLDHKIFWGRRDVMDSFASSFHRFVPKEILLSMFTVTELVQTLMIDNEISMIDWKENTAYNNCTINQQEIQWFWEIISTFTTAEKRSILAFCTGSKYLPLGGFKRFSAENSPFTIQIHESLAFGTLPTSRTCFNTLILPNYNSKTQMEKNFRLVIKEQEAGVGFAFV